MKKFLLLFTIIGLGLILNSCYDELVNNPSENKPPKTSIFLFPDSTISQQPSKLRVSWWGDDPDGLVIGFYFTWDGVNWTFTTKNDSLFALQIGATDTFYNFKVAAADDGGNGVYDNQILRNGIDFGAEPFIDANGDGVYNPGEKYFDIGLIDPNPATIKFPIRNSAPVIVWNNLSVLPDTSFPAMTFGWEAEDLDGDESILKINIALNDTSDQTKIVSLQGNVRRITIRTREFSSANPKMDILIDGSDASIFNQKLEGLKFNDFNKFYVQAEDISGAKSPFIELPDTSKKWYVKKPAGRLLIINDYLASGNPKTFYKNQFDSVNSGSINGKYDFWDIHVQKPPYQTITFLETIKLFDFVFWYSDNNPSLNLATVATNKFISAGGAIAFSFWPGISLEVENMQGFLPIDSVSNFVTGLNFPNNSRIISDSTLPEYPNLQTSQGVFLIRGYYPNPLSATPIYYAASGDPKGYLGFIDSRKKIFFMGIPLHYTNGGNRKVNELLTKIFFQDFGLN